ncbi:MAG: peptide chain release factor N(5)-glutamine methyltransferase [Desulfobulbales bacterium]
MQIRKVYHTAVQRLKEADIPEPELEASLLLSHSLHMDRSVLLLSGEKVISPEQLLIFQKNISRRLKRVPLAYIIGEKEFWSLPFKVTPDVLIPRPETEFLLEKVFAKAKGVISNFSQSNKILDLGTGSGVLAVIMALELEGAKITAIDYSFKALKVAIDNAKKHEVAERISFINCNWFAGIKSGTQFDMIISNPPYIAQEILAKPGEVKDSLQPEVINFEPKLALDGGERGVEPIKKIAGGLEGFLKSGGWFFMEIGADQKEEIMEIFSETGSYDSMEVFDDYAGLPRVFQAQKCCQDPLSEQSIFCSRKV